MANSPSWDIIYLQMPIELNIVKEVRHRRMCVLMCVQGRVALGHSPKYFGVELTARVQSALVRETEVAHDETNLLLLWPWRLAQVSLRVLGLRDRGLSSQVNTPHTNTK